jgi:DNA polymerase-3 subunit delta
VQLKPDQLEAALKRGLAPLYVVHGDEHLLVIEAGDAIRRATQRAGFTERCVLHCERSFSWARLAEQQQSMSLFGERKLIDLRIPGGKPGRDGSAALIAHAAAPNADVVTLVTLPRLEREARQSSWFSALESAGTSIEVPTIDAPQLPAWIAQRLARQQQSTSAEGLRFIAERVEGNLLAAHQEVQKLALLCPSGEIGLTELEDAVMNVARYHVFKLGEALLAGDGVRLARMIEGLRAEGESPVLVHWALSEEIRTLVLAQEGRRLGQPLATLLRERRVWGPRERLYGTALDRLREGLPRRALLRAAELDRMIKGLRVRRALGDVWDELLRLALMFAHTPKAARA